MMPRRTGGVFGIRAHAVLLVAVSLAACAVCGCARKGLAPGEGFIPVTGGRVWYRIVGSGTATPLLVLHGGPGVPSYYLKPLAALADERPVVFYDQLGCGHSTGPTDSTLWRTERFVEELGQVRKALGLEQVHLLGHSWGTILAAEYLFTKPTGVRSVIFAGPALDLATWERDADSLRKTLPDSTQAKIRRHEQDGDFQSPEYQSAMNEYYRRYLCRKDPWPADVDSCFAGMGPAYLTMDGPSEFTITGSLKGYSAVSRLGQITIPTLFTVGQFDEATPRAGAYYQSLIPGAKLAIIDGAGHLSMQDSPEAYAQVVRQFLRDAEAAKP